MDQTRFDDLTRRLGAGATRRAGLKAALGGLLGMGTVSRPAEGEARKRRRKKRARLECSATKPCPAGMFCFEYGGGSQCFCDDSGQPACGEVCCPAGQTCTSTADGLRCACDADGRLACNGVCCNAGDACAGGICCPELRACGTVCCAQGRECRNAQCLVPTGECRPRGWSCAIQGQQCCGMLTCQSVGGARETACR